MLARRDGAGVRLLTRRGIDWTTRYPAIAAAIATLACRSCLIDGEVVICGEDGIPVFDRGLARAWRLVPAGPRGKTAVAAPFTLSRKARGSALQPAAVKLTARRA